MRARTVVAFGAGWVLGLVCGLGIGQASEPAAPPEPPARPVVFYLRSYGEVPAGSARPDILAAVAQRATLVVPEVCGPESWGNDCAVAEAHRLRLLHSPDRPVRVLALSMGNLTLARWAARWPDDVDVAVGLVPATTTRHPGLAPYGAPAHLDPARPWTGIERYVCWVASRDVITGPPLPGTCHERHELAGGHDPWLAFPVEAIVEILAGSVTP